MKCRKCGHQIEVRSAVTETSVSGAPPSKSTQGSDAARPLVRSGLATSLSAAKPRAPSGPSAQPSHAHGSALAGAFQRTVQGSSTAPPSFQGQGAGLDISVTDEWYVAINGVPVGPVRISELRRKAASGAVTEDSLCWQEGLEEWRAVRSIPELAALVREAAQSQRPSLVAPSERASSPPRAPGRPLAPSRAPEAPRGDTHPPRPASALGPTRSNVVPLRPSFAASADDKAGAGPTLMGGSLGPLGASSSGAGAFGAAALAQQPHAALSPALPPPPRPVSDPFASPPAPFALPTDNAGAPFASPAFLAPSPSIPPPQPKRGAPLWFWPILVFACVFGVAAAVISFRQSAPAPLVVQMPPATAAATADTRGDIPIPAASVDVLPTSTAPTAKVATVGASGTAPKNGAAPVVTQEKKGLDVSGLLGGAGGPNLGGGAGPGAGAGGGLDSSSVERVVASHRSGVKRTCWERGGADQKSSVNVTVSATVAPDGSVSGTSSSGDDPVVAKCIEQQVRAWRFNAPGAATTVNIPFKFVRQ